MRNLTPILTDNGGAFVPGTLGHTFFGPPADNSASLQKNDLRPPGSDPCAASGAAIRPRHLVGGERPRTPSC